MTLISTTDERWTKEERIEFFLSGIIAIDPDTGAEMDASGGQRKSGRGRRYSCSVPSGETRMGYLNTSNPRPIPFKRRAFSVTAHTEREAIDRANKALARFLRKKPRWSDEQYNWVFDKQEAA